MLYCARMRISIHAKLSFGLVSFTACILMASLLLTRWSFVSAFDEYIYGLEQNRLENIAHRMSELYATHSAWPRNIEHQFQGVSNRPPRHVPPHLSEPPRNNQRPSARLQPRTGPHPTALFDLEGKRIAGADLHKSSQDRASVPILVGDQLVGHVQSVPRLRISRPLEHAFSRRQSETSIVIGIVSILLAILFATYLASLMLAPVRRLLGGVSELSRGNYAVELKETRNDELGDLMTDFDFLAVTLRKTQQARQRMFADISHELRTPLTILSAELEALRDGVREFNRENLDSLEEEVARLRHLIDDLYEISTSDLGALRYTFAPRDLQDILSNALRTLPASELNITTTLESAMVSVDERRIDQLFRNLLWNAIAYTDVPEHIEVRLTNTPHMSEVTLSDTAPSVPLEQCQHLFDPLYRVEESRSRRTAGAGLGLAISRKIVEAHSGTITAEPSSLGGIKITVRLPRLEST